MLANWLASPENPYFATNLANIVWAHFFGAGIVEQVDDVRVSNPASQPGAARRAGQAVHRLQVRLQEARPRHLHLADVSALDAARTRRNEADDAELRPRPIRRDPGRERCSTASAQVTETKDKFPGLPLGARAVQIADGGTSAPTS